MTEKYTIKPGFTQLEIDVLNEAIRRSSLPERVVIYPYPGIDTLLAEMPLKKGLPHAVVLLRASPKFYGTRFEEEVRARKPVSVPMFTQNVEQMTARFNGEPGPESTVLNPSPLR